MKVWKTKEIYREMFTNLGKELELPNELKTALSKYVCHLYGLEECSDVNYARYELFKAENTKNNYCHQTKTPLTNTLVGPIFNVLSGDMHSNRY